MESWRYEVEVILWVWSGIGGLCGVGGKKVGEGVFDWYVDPGIGLTGLTKGVGWWTWAW